MKKVFLAAALAAASAAALAQQSVYVQPHVTRDGDFVQGHYRTAPNSTRMDNWSTQGNLNPYTGQAGTVNPYASPGLRSVPSPYYQTPIYGSPLQQPRQPRPY